jgi:prepilin-type N-terminal cleavage/methylation domain-containing protein
MKKLNRNLKQAAYQNENRLGFTLIEMLLVLVIVGSFIYMGLGYFQQQTLATRMTKSTAQMQQILSAGMSYYLNNGSWPSSIDCLLGTGAVGSGCEVPYLGVKQIMSPWGTPYHVVSINTVPKPDVTVVKPNLLYVYFSVSSTQMAKAPAAANIIAGKLPMAYASVDTGAVPAKGIPLNDVSCKLDSASSACFVVASVNIPGMSLNTAPAVNFASIYHSGACVPVPTCPLDQNGNQMVPEIIGVPAALAGMNAPPTAVSGGQCNSTDVSGCQGDVYPISSYSVSATGPIAITAAVGPPDCNGVGTGAACLKDSVAKITPGQKYWRICLSMKTQAGTVTPADQVGTTGTAWGQLVGAVMVITRCSIAKEESGSGFTVWSP